METIPKAVNHLLFLMAFINAMLFFGACAVYHLPNMGFNTLIVTILSVLHNGALWEVLNNGRIFPHESYIGNSQFTIGVMLGLTVGMALLLFVVSIYFGQLSNCDSSDMTDELIQYACDSKVGMWSVWFFASIGFMIDCALVALLGVGKEELVAEQHQYDDIGLVEEYDPSSVTRNF